MKSKIRKSVDNVKDASNEVKHRSKATAEHVKRTVTGEKLTPGDKVKSYAREDLEDTKADVDRAKRKLRK